jgi:hypothetical protein
MASVQTTGKTEAMKKYILALLLAAALSPDFATTSGKLGAVTINYCDCVGKGGPPTKGQTTSPVMDARFLPFFISLNLFVLGIEG